MTLALRPFGPTGLLVSELALGALTFGRETDERESAAMVGSYLDHGGNLIDTADIYGESETILGRVLGRRRDDVVIASKVGLPPFAPGETRLEQGASRHHIRRQVERSLRRLATDHIDLYQVHCWDPSTPLRETLSTLDDLVRQGEVRYVGVSNFAGWHVQKALGTAAQHGLEPVVSVSPQYSLVERGFDRDLAGVCEAESLAVLPYSPLGGGLLTGKYRSGATPPADSRAGRVSASTASMLRRLHDARNGAIVDAVGRVAAQTGRTSSQVALNWVMGRPAVTAPVLGARSLAQLTENLGAAGWRLADEHRALLDEVSAIDLGYPHDWLQHHGLRGPAEAGRGVTDAGGRRSGPA